MTRKRYKKLMMSCGMSRNHAEEWARYNSAIGYPYKHAIVPDRNTYNLLRECPRSCYYNGGIVTGQGGR